MTAVKRRVLEVMVPRKGRILASLVAVGMCGGSHVQAQSNLDAGKSPAQIFAATCNACHRSPREIKRTSAAFLREHYTTEPREAAAMAAYLAGIASDPAAIQHRRPPVLGAGQQPAPGETATAAAPAAGEQSEASNGKGQEKPAAPRPRRPSESIEFGSAPSSPDGAVSVLSPQTGPASPGKAAAKLDIEE